MVATILQEGNQPIMNSLESSLSSTNRTPNENRRSNKPIMEKRRRARINNCLNELKALILEAMKKDPARHSKLEKADILEMTVKYLQNLQRQRQAGIHGQSTFTKFRAGFLECISETGRYSGLDLAEKQRLLHHLTNCISQRNIPREQQSKHMQVIFPNPALQEQAPQLPTRGLHCGSNDVQLVPTTLVSSNGNTFALVLPSSQGHTNQTNHQVPMFVASPSRVASISPTVSPHQGSISSTLNPEMSQRFNMQYFHQGPINLTVNRPVEERPCWRPW